SNDARPLLFARSMTHDCAMSGSPPGGEGQARTGFPSSPGSRHGPSAWSKRLPAAVLALAGCAIASYLGLFQVGLLADVWEPFFGNGSRLILKESAVARSLPVPDAALGALVYLAEAMAECFGGRQRWRTWRAAVFASGALAAGLGLAAVVLVGC